MKKIRLFFVSCLSILVIVTGCTKSDRTAVNPANDSVTSTVNPAVVQITQTTTIPSVETVTEEENITTPNIVDMSWDSEQHIVALALDSWPAVWSGSTLLIDGIGIPLIEEEGAVIYRPNAPLDQPPDGFIIGTLPWVSGLDQVDFPCCGTAQISFSGAGLTNTYDYNFKDLGCTTASIKVCPAEWTVHEGDIVIDDTNSFIIEDTKFLQKGNIYVNDSATLTVKNSELMIERGDTPTIHVYIFVEPGARLIIDNSKIYPGPDNGGLTCVINHGTATIINSPTSIHYFDMSDGAILTMENSSMIYEIGGLLQVTGGKTNLIDTTIASLGIAVPAEAHLDVSGLKSGAHFDKWKVQDMIAEATYELNFSNVTLLTDDFSGELEHGPYERGWIFFLDPNSHVRLSDSELRKIFLSVRNETVEFNDLQIGKPSSLIYRDIVLKDVVVNGEWPFEIINANVKINNSDYLFLQPSGDSIVQLKDSHIVEFIPRNFTGTMIFENSTWTNAGEILGDVDYHSTSNNFTIKGGLSMSDNLRTNLQWKNAQVTREFELVLRDSHGDPIQNGVIKVQGKNYITDENGKTTFVMQFTDDNYNTPTELEIWISGKIVDQTKFDFFTGTPINISVQDSKD